MTRVILKFGECCALNVALLFFFGQIWKAISQLQIQRTIGDADDGPQVMQPMIMQGQIMQPAMMPGQVMQPVMMPGQVMQPMIMQGQVMQPMMMQGQVVQTPFGLMMVPFGPQNRPGGMMMGKPAEFVIPESSPEQIQQQISSGPTLVLFFTLNSFDSQLVQSTWDIVAQKLNNSQRGQSINQSLSIAKIDAVRYDNFADSHDVHELPNILLFMNGGETASARHSKMAMGHTFSWQSIVNWVLHHMESIHELHDRASLDAFLHENVMGVIGLFPDGASTGALAKASQEFDSVTFAEATSARLSKEVLERVAQHVAEDCTTVTVGPSQEFRVLKDLKNVTMSGKRAAIGRLKEFAHAEDVLWECANTPVNPQRSDWSDKFSADVQGGILVVKRTDTDSEIGWAQNLQIRCCANTDSSTKETEIKDKLHVPGVVMITPYEPGYSIYEGDMKDVDQLEKWIRKESMPTTIQCNQDDIMFFLDQLWDSKNKMPLLVVVHDNSEKGQKVKEGLGALDVTVPMLRGRATSTICKFQMGSDEDPFAKRVMDIVSLTPADMPAAAGIWQGGDAPHGQVGKLVKSGKRFHLKSEIIPESIQRFLEDWEQGKLHAAVKSEREPDDPYTGAVHALVGTTYWKAVMNPGKDVFVDAYAPWCGYSQRLKPTYQQLARKLKHVKTLDIAWIDASANDVEGHPVENFPTLLFYPAGKKDAIAEYKGDRSLNNLIAWLHAHATHAFSDEAPPSQEMAASSSLLTDEEESADL